MSFDPNARAPQTRGLRAWLAALLAVAGGLFVGHFIWTAATSVTTLGSGAHQRIALRRPAGSVPIPSGGVAGNGSSESSAGEGEGEGEGEGAGSVAAQVDPAIVDINTELGLQHGAAAGTGMVVTSSGEVITNNHVIAGATHITATDVGNGQTYNAHVVGFDRRGDIAVLQLEGASGLKTVTFSHSNSVQTGQQVVTIGNAGGVGGTPSAAGGRVAAVNRSITASDELDGTSERLEGLIQVEGDVRPGDSGGPMVNASGEVVGMDTAASSTFKVQSSGTAGFAIPSQTLEAIANQIVEGRSSSSVHIGATGLLGVYVGQNPAGGEGAYVQGVISEAPAASSEVVAGDSITAVNGTRVGSATELTEALLAHHPGDTVRISWRDPSGEERSSAVTLGEGPPA